MKSLRLLPLALLALAALDARAQSPFVTLSTADGRGADAHVRGDNPGHKQTNSDTNFGAEPRLLLKGSPNGGYHRAIFLRFDLAALKGAKVDTATLELTATDDFKKWISATVYALKDPLPPVEGKLGLDWDEAALTWNNAPSQPAEIDKALREDTGQAVKLGELTLRNFKAGAKVTFAHPSLVAAINNSASGTITLVLESAKDANALFASRQHPELAPPALKVTRAP